MCRGGIQGSYPIYLLPDTLLTERIVHDKHVPRGGVGLTMSFVRQHYFVPRLTELNYLYEIEESVRIRRLILGC